jgi:hypothetical protein
MTSLNKNIVALLVFSAFAACLAHSSLSYLIILCEKYKF